MEFKNKTFLVGDGAGMTGFLAQTEPDAKGFVHGQLALDSDGEVVLMAEPAKVSVEELLDADELKGVVWPQGVAA